MNLQTSLPNPKHIQNLKRKKQLQGAIFVVLIWKNKSPPWDYYCNFIIPFGNMLLPLLTAEFFGNMLLPLLTAELLAVYCLHWYKSWCLIPLHWSDDARWTPPWKGKRCWYGCRVDASLIPDFYGAGGVPIPQTGNFHRRQQKHADRCGDRTYEGYDL